MKLSSWPLAVFVALAIYPLFPAFDQHLFNITHRSLGDQMAGSRDLPMGGHDIAKLSSPEAVGAFERYVQVTRDLMALLQRLDAQNEQMLAMMRGSQRPDQ